MKQSIALLSAAAAIVSAAKPVLLNSSYSVTEGEPFTLTFEGCDAGCTITLETGPDEDSFKPVQTLTTDATGGEATVTVDSVSTSGTYAFRITDNETSEYNFGGSFELEGSGSVSTTATTSEATETTTEAESTTTEAETTTTEEETSTTTTEEETTTTEESTTEETTSTPESTSFTTTTSEAETTTTEASTTTSDEATTTNEENPASTVPDGAAGSLGRPMALVVGAVVAMLLLN